MKKYFLGLLVVFLGISLYAQDAEVNPEWQGSGDWVYGAYVGYTTNTLSETPFNDPNAISGNSYLLGVQANYFFAQNWSLKGKLNFENRNFGLGGSEYLNFTLSPVWHFGKNKRWHLQLGAAYSAPLTDSTIDGAFETDLGIGVIIPIGSSRFFIELDGVTNTNALEINLTDVNGAFAGTKSLNSNRSSINFGILF